MHPCLHTAVIFLAGNPDVINLPTTRSVQPAEPVLGNSIRLKSVAYSYKLSAQQYKHHSLTSLTLPRIPQCHCSSGYPLYLYCPAYPSNPKIKIAFNACNQPFQRKKQTKYFLEKETKSCTRSLYATKKSNAKVQSPC